MTVTKTHHKNHIDNLDTLEDLFKKANKIICLDAFISNKTLNTLSLMNIPFKFYNFTLPLEQRTCLSFKEETGFTGKLMKDLQEGKRIYFFCSSNKKLTEVFLPLIRKTFPTKKVIEYQASILLQLTQTGKMLMLLLVRLLSRLVVILTSKEFLTRCMFMAMLLLKTLFVTCSNLHTE